jgi:uncharacterized membrane-anchored protein YhcB (DUF1043 family)
MQQELAVLRHGHRTLTKESQHLAGTCTGQQTQVAALTEKLTSLQAELDETQRQAQRHLNRTAFLKQELESVRSLGQDYEQQAKRFAKDPAPLLEAKVSGLEAQLAHVHARNEVLEQELQLQAKGGSSDVTSARYMDYDPRTTKVVRLVCLSCMHVYMCFPCLFCLNATVCQVGLKVTPLTMLKQEQAQLVQTLKEENQALIAQLGETNPVANISGRERSAQHALPTCHGFACPSGSRVFPRD